MAVAGAPDPATVAADAARSLAEDIQTGDVTAALLENDQESGYVIAKEAAVICGRPWFDACFRQLDPEIAMEWLVDEGQAVTAGTVVVRFRGKARALVGAERSALNFLQTLSATASQTAAFAQALAGSRTRVLDTRKTLPGLRLAQKYAVRIGGGMNHRMGLFDAVMLKENHIIAEGSITAAVKKARSLYPDIPVIVEVENLTELREALATDCTRVLIDDFSDDDMFAAVRIADGRKPLEVSGSVSMERLAVIRESGVDFISVGAITKNIRAIDFSMRLGNPP
ncbi:carboxylating nicotinate-nucleotide diphosphorylase [Arenimonas sp. GDDSR-1]|uniref:carboxylating nicotinate-nucleotide diphosphorylase n=1 Tax=Arenimonas sp. GDDSR-1 TaxID=2950125 RepID=UPI002609FA26|nr:carboxylating nicotinate-nucleotide diphosphorylase [Arenimonas sp. GDDSR-1]